ncbi:MAG: hypothetical protein QM784_19230 [Polyangiaceae bacterium]
MRHVFAGAALPLLLACGSKGANEPPKTASNAPPPTQVTTPAPDLSPVATPAELVALGRVARPSAMASTFAGWVAVPFEPKMLDAIEPGLSEAISVDAPVEFAVVLPSSGDMTDVKPQAVVTFGVANTDKAKALLEGYNGAQLKEQAPGVWTAAEGAKAQCAVAASLGKTTARLVCGSDEASVSALLPYATRGLPLENLGSANLRAEVRAAPLQRKFAAAARMGKTMGVPALLKLIALDDPKFNRPLADVAHALGDEFIDWFEDLDRIALELVVQSQPEQVGAKISIAYKSHKSLLATAASSAQKRMAPPGPLFFDLPADVTSAGYISAADPKLLERPRMLTNAVIDGFLAHIDVGAELRRSVIKGLDSVVSRGDAAASGHLPVSLPTGKAPTEAEQMAATIGTYVVAIDGPAAAYRDALRAFEKLDADPGFKRGIDRIFSEKLAEIDGDKAEDAESGAKAKAKQKPAKAKAVSHLVTLKPKAVKGLPAGSQTSAFVFEMKETRALIEETQPDLKRKRGLSKLAVERFTLLVSVIPDGNRTWLLLEIDQREIRLRALGDAADIAAAKRSRTGQRRHVKNVSSRDVEHRAAGDAGVDQRRAHLLQHVERIAVGAQRHIDATPAIAADRLQHHAAARESDGAMGDAGAAGGEALQILGLCAARPAMAVDEDAMAEDEIRAENAERFEIAHGGHSVTAQQFLMLGDGLGVHER